jgi:hypothetical protein
MSRHDLLALANCYYGILFPRPGSVPVREILFEAECRAFRPNGSTQS